MVHTTNETTYEKLGTRQQWVDAARRWAKGYEKWKQIDSIADRCSVNESASVEHGKDSAQQERPAQWGQKYRHLGSHVNWLYKMSDELYASLKVCLQRGETATLTLIRSSLSNENVSNLKDRYGDFENQSLACSRGSKRGWSSQDQSPTDLDENHYVIRFNQMPTNAHWPVLDLKFLHRNYSCSSSKLYSQHIGCYVCLHHRDFERG